MWLFHLGVCFLLWQREKIKRGEGREWETLRERGGRGRARARYRCHESSYLFSEALTVKSIQTNRYLFRVYKVRIYLVRSYEVIKQWKSLPPAPDYPEELWHKTLSLTISIATPILAKPNSPYSLCAFESRLSSVGCYKIKGTWDGSFPWKDGPVGETNWVPLEGFLYPL